MEVAAVKRGLQVASPPLAVQGLVALLTGIFLILPQAGSVLAAEKETPAPKLRLATSEPIHFRVVKGGLFDFHSKTYTASTTFPLANDGDLIADNISLLGYASNGQSLSVNHAPNSVVTVAPGGYSIIHLAFTWSESLPADGWLFISAPHQSSTLVVKFSVDRVVPAVILAKSIWVSFIIACLLLLFVHLVFVFRGRVNRPGWNTELSGASATWSFKESWASNLTALGATLGTILGATGFISEVLPGVSLGGFVGINVLFGFMILLAPVAFVALSSSEKGTYGGLFSSAALTISASLGELSIVGTLLTRSGLSRWWTTPPILAAVALIWAYIYRSFSDLIRPPAAVAMVPGGRKTSVL
jgi:hypothetical protein